MINKSENNEIYAHCRNTIPPSGTKSPRLCLVVAFLVICPVQVVVSIVVINETDLIFIGDGVTGVAPLVSVWPRTTTAVALFVDWALQFCVTGVLLAATDTYLRGPFGSLQQTNTIEERHLLSSCGLCECRWRFWDDVTVYRSVSAFDWATTGPMFAIAAKSATAVLATFRTCRHQVTGGAAFVATRTPGTAMAIIIGEHGHLDWPTCTRREGSAFGGLTRVDGKWIGAMKAIVDFLESVREFQARGTVFEFYINHHSFPHDFVDVLRCVTEELVHGVFDVGQSSETVDFPGEFGVADLREGLVDSELRVSVTAQIPPLFSGHLLEVASPLPYVDRDGATFESHPFCPSDFGVIRRILNVGCEHSTRPSSCSVVVGVLYVNWVKQPTITAVGDESRRGMVRVLLFFWLVIVDGAESPKGTGDFLVKWLCASSQLRSKGALGRIVRH
jgi:hypothetical protein